ncbi:MAG TPA: hypothetical protein VEU96_04200 [Bryobacteraceae bacterium]|nr:hypothetical protein [Bryobacteraceae bacterium]
MITFKTISHYVAYAPDVGRFSYGACFDDALNGLTDELRDLETNGDVGKPTAMKRRAVKRISFTANRNPERPKVSLRVPSNYI